MEAAVSCFCDKGILSPARTAHFHFIYLARKEIFPACPDDIAHICLGLASFIFKAYNHPVVHTVKLKHIKRCRGSDAKPAPLADCVMPEPSVPAQEAAVCAHDIAWSVLLPDEIGIITSVEVLAFQSFAFLSS